MNTDDERLTQTFPNGIGIGSHSRHSPEAIFPSVFIRVHPWLKLFSVVAAPLTGRQNRTVVPWPDLLSTSNRPPRFSTRVRMLVMPSISSVRSDWTRPRPLSET